VCHMFLPLGTGLGFPYSSAPRQTLQDKRFISLYGKKHDAFDFHPACDDKIHFSDRWRWDAQKERTLGQLRARACKACDQKV